MIRNWCVIFDQLAYLVITLLLLCLLSYFFRYIAFKEFFQFLPVLKFFGLFFVLKFFNLLF